MKNYLSASLLLLLGACASNHNGKPTGTTIKSPGVNCSRKLDISSASKTVISAYKIAIHCQISESDFSEIIEAN